MLESVDYFIHKLLDCELPSSSEALAKQQELFFQSCVLRSLHQGVLQRFDISERDLQTMNVRDFIKKLGVFDYNALKPFIDSRSLTKQTTLYMGRTSGTSDGNNGGKDIPITRVSIEFGEQKAMKHTLWSVVFEQGGRFLLQGKALVLSGSFDGYRGYISGIINNDSGLLGDFVTYPPKEILGISDWQNKKSVIINNLKHDDVRISSIHGVPIWPLELLQDIADYDQELAKKVCSPIRYISIGGGPPLDYKRRYVSFLKSLGITEQVAFTNNHNATEGFFASQQRNFFDIDFHWMQPHIRGNVFAFVPLECWNSEDLYNNTNNIVLLHEMVPGVEYVQIILNDRIPLPYVIKDVVQCNEYGEYLVTGRVGMASNVANEHIEQKHILECLHDLHEKYPSHSDYFAIAGVELTSSNQLVFHRCIESQDLSDREDVAMYIHQWFIDHHEQYKGFVGRGKIIGVKVYPIAKGQIIQHLKNLGRRHEQSKIPHIGNGNFKEIIQTLVCF